MVHELDQLRQSRDHRRTDVLELIRWDRASVGPRLIVAQLVGGAVAIVILRILYPDVTPEGAAKVVMPHRDGRAASDDSLVAHAPETR